MAPAFAAPSARTTARIVRGSIALVAEAAISRSSAGSKIVNGVRPSDHAVPDTHTQQSRRGGERGEKGKKSFGSIQHFQMNTVEIVIAFTA